MPVFEESRWADSEFSRNYRDDSNVFLPFRYHFFKTAISLYGHFIGTNPEARIIDLGCGDGLFIEELLSFFSPATVTLVDGSEDMLDAAKKRLGDRNNIRFINASFQNLMSGRSFDHAFEFIFSSLAIHHLSFEEKKKLYACIYDILSPGGLFVNYDVVDPSAEKNEKWYLELWRKWITEHADEESQEKLLGVPDEYKGNPDNLPDTLEAQLELLRSAGFKEVDCYFKYGVFALFGGEKQPGINQRSDGE